MRSLVLLLAMSSTAWAEAADPAETALRLLGKPREIKAAVLTPWPGAPSGERLVVAGVVAATDDEYQADLWVGVLARRGRDLAVVGRSLTRLDLGGALWNVTVSSDFAPYEIRPGERAFGVRVRDEHNSGALSATVEMLALFRLQGPSLSRVFECVVKKEGFRKNEEGTALPPDENYERIIVVSRRKTEGFFDLLVRDRKTKATIATYAWAQGRYVNAAEKPAMPTRSPSR
jgi:hypothetical protein